MKSECLKLDHRVICDIIEFGSSVLDLGSGDGELLSLLSEKRSVKGQGIEIKEEAIYKCVERGLSVFHSDIDTGLSEYPDKSFDYVILNQSLQEAKNVIFVIDEALRVGKKVIVGFPNFAYVRARTRLFFKGKTPVTKSLPYRWYNTPNLHFLSISDFIDFCRDKNIKIIKALYLSKDKVIKFLPNLFALNAVFVIEKAD